MSPNSFPMEVIIGVAVAGSMFVLIIVLLVVIILLCAVKGKHNSYAVSSPPKVPNGNFREYNIDNPNYEGTTHYYNIIAPLPVYQCIL